MRNSGGAEFFDGRLHAGAGGPDVVEKKIGGGGVDVNTRVDLISSFGLGESGGTVGADLGSIVGAKKELLNLEMLKFRKMLGDEKGVVKTASTNVLGGSGEGDEVSVCGKRWKGSV